MSQTPNQTAQVAELNAAIDTLLDDPERDDPDLARATALMLYIAALPNLADRAIPSPNKAMPPRLQEFHQQVKNTMADYPEDIPFPMPTEITDRSEAMVALLFNVSKNAAVQSLHALYWQAENATTRRECLQALNSHIGHHGPKASGVGQTIINDPDDHLLSRLTERARAAHLATGKIVAEIIGHPLPGK